MVGFYFLKNILGSLFEPCTSNKDLYAAYAYNQNKTIVYACWKIDGEDIVFLNSFPQLIKIPVKQFIKPPKLNDPR